MIPGQFDRKLREESFPIGPRAQKLTKWAFFQFFLLSKWLCRSRSRRFKSGGNGHLGRAPWRPGGVRRRGGTPGAPGGDHPGHQKLPKCSRKYRKQVTKKKGLGEGGYPRLDPRKPGDLDRVKKMGEGPPCLHRGLSRGLGAFCEGGTPPLKRGGVVGGM